MKAREFFLWMVAGLLTMAAALAIAPRAHSQSIDSAIYVKQFAGQANTVGGLVTIAMRGCPSAPVPCILVLDPSLAAWATGTMPSPCGNCYFVDWRSGPPVNSGSSTIGPVITLAGGVQPAGTLQAAITRGGAGSTIVLPGNYSETLTAAATLSAANQTLRCEQGAVLAKNGNFDLLAVSGASEKVSGCIFDGNQSGSFTGNVVTLTGSSNAVIDGNEIRNAYGQNLYGTNFSGARISNNYIHGGLNSAISFSGAAGNVNGLLIVNNILDSTTGTNPDSSKDIELHSVTSGNSIFDVQIEGNLLLNGRQWAIEWGAFGGGATHGIHIVGNHAIAQANTNGCYSSGSPSWGDLIASNTCSANGFEFSVASYEIVQNFGSTWTGNEWHEAGGEIQIGISLNSSSDQTISGTHGGGWSGWNGTNAGGAMLINDNYSTFSTCGRLGTSTCYTNSNNIGGNTFIQGSTDVNNANTHGIFFQANSATAQINLNKVHDNIVVVNGASSSPDGIFPQTSSGGTIDSNEFTNNQVQGAHVGFEHGSETNAYILNFRCFSCTNLTGGTAGSGTLYVDPFASNAVYTFDNCSTACTAQSVSMSSQTMVGTVPGASGVKYTFDGDISQTSLGTGCTVSSLTLTLTWTDPDNGVQYVQGVPMQFNNSSSWNTTATFAPSSGSIASSSANVARFLLPVIAKSGTILKFQTGYTGTGCTAGWVYTIRPNLTANITY